jgi:hypothetical protein
MSGRFGIEQQRPVELFQSGGDMLTLGTGNAPRDFRRMGGEYRDKFDLPQSLQQLFRLDAALPQPPQSTPQGARFVRRFGRHAHSPQAPFAMLDLGQVDQFEKRRKRLDDLAGIVQ